MPRPVVLDTDIGTNVDDLWALLLLARATEVDLVGVVTVAGGTGARAAVARHVLDVAGRPDVPVIAGATTTLSGRASRWLGHEADVLPAGTRTGDDDTSPDATEWLLERIDGHDGDLEVVAVGPLTNLAGARRRHPATFARIRRLYVMGGDRGGGTETNLATDAVAAAEVFAAGVELVRCGLEVTRSQVVDDRALAAAVARHAGNRAVAELVLAESRRYWAAIGVDGSPAHDPLAALVALEPDRFTVEIEHVAVTPAGMLTDAPAGPRPTSAVTGVAEGTVEALLDRILA